MQAALAATLDQPRALQHPQVLGDGGQGDAERTGELRDGGLPDPKPGQDRASRGVGEGGEGRVEPERLMINHMVKYRSPLGGRKGCPPGGSWRSVSC